MSTEADSAGNAEFRQQTIMAYSIDNRHVYMVRCIFPSRFTLAVLWKHDSIWQAANDSIKAQVSMTDDPAVAAHLYHRCSSYSTTQMADTYDYQAAGANDNAQSYFSILCPLIEHSLNMAMQHASEKLQHQQLASLINVRLSPTMSIHRWQSKN